MTRRRDPLIAAIDAARNERGWSTREFDRQAGRSAGQWARILTHQAGHLFTLTSYARAVGLALAVVPAPRQLRPHGTAAAAKRHRYHREPLCALCRAWDRDRKRAARANGPGPSTGPSTGEAEAA